MKTKQNSRYVKLAALLIVAIFGLGLQSSVALSSERQEVPSNLNINMKRALEIANEVSSGSVSEIELEQEDGKWVYEAELKTPNGGEKEILIDAQTGSVLKVETEDDDEDDKEDENDEKED